MINFNGNGKLITTLAFVVITLGANFTILNGPQFLLTCSKFIASSQPSSTYFNILSQPQCIPIDTDEDLALMTMWFYAGGGIGTLITDMINFYHLISLKWELLLGHTFNIIGMCLLWVSDSVWMVYLGRLICGVGTGVQVSALPVYLSLLITDLKVASTWIIAMFNYILAPLGILLCQLLSKPLLDSFHWRYIFLIQLVLQMASLFPLFEYVLESPKWYLVKGYPHPVVKSCLSHYYHNSTPAQLDSIIAQWTREVELQQRNSNEAQRGKGLFHNYFFNWSQFLHKREHHQSLKWIILIIPLQLINTQWINQYSMKLFTDILPDPYSMNLTILLSSIQVVSSVPHLLNVRKTRGLTKRPLYLSHYTSMMIGIMLLILSFSFKYKEKGLVVSITCLVILTLTQSVIGMNKIFIGSLEPANGFGSHAIRLSRVCFWLGQIVSSYTFPLLFDLMGHTVFLWLLTILILMNIGIKLYNI